MAGNYIVTGGAGFIGSNLAIRLIQAGGTVYILDDLSTGFMRNVPDKAVFHKIDLSCAEDILKLNLPENIDTIYHMAGQSSGEASFDDPVHDIRANYLATYNTLKLAANKHCKRFIYASSMSVYGEANENDACLDEEHVCDPVSFYGCNKLASEKLIKVFVKRNGIRSTIFRFFNVYGPGQNMNNMKQGMASIYMSYLMKDVRIIVKGSLDRFRDFIYINDLIDVLVNCEQNPATFDDIFNVGTSLKTTVNDLLQAMLTAFNKDNFDKWVVVQGKTPGDIKGFTANIDKISHALQWRPKYNINQGIALMKLWIDQTIHLWRD